MGGGGGVGKPEGMTRTAETRGGGTLHAGQAGLHPTLMAGLVQPLKGLKSEKLGLLSAAVEGRNNQALQRYSRCCCRYPSHNDSLTRWPRTVVGVPQREGRAATVGGPEERLPLGLGGVHTSRHA